MGQFVGKYRGTVLNNIDPHADGTPAGERARRRQRAADVLGDAVPAARRHPGRRLRRARDRRGVWIEFEHGDADYPIWTGCFWGSAAEIPALALAGAAGDAADRLQTTMQNTLLISDMPGPTGGILLKTMTGAMISINDIGITISNGQGATIMLAGPTVTVNDGALVVT